MVQLWINLPKKHKMAPAKYQSIMHASKPNIQLPENAGSVHVVAGEYKGYQRNWSTFSPVNIYDMYLNAGGRSGF